MRLLLPYPAGDGRADGIDSQMMPAQAGAERYLVIRHLGEAVSSGGFNLNEERKHCLSPLQ